MLLPSTKTMAVSSSFNVKLIGYGLNCYEKESIEVGVKIDAVQPGSFQEQYRMCKNIGQDESASVTTCTMECTHPGDQPEEFLVRISGDGPEWMLCEVNLA